MDMSMVIRLAIAGAMLAGAAGGASAYVASGEQKLKKLLLPHAYYGQRVTDDVRAATGDPNIVVFDRRHIWGEIYSCNYITYNGKRAMVCD
jgi:hypothetical protein